MKKECKSCGKVDEIPKKQNKCMDCRVEYNRHYLKSKHTPEELAYLRWKYFLKAKYKMTPEDWNRMYEEQGGLCAICFTPEEDTPKGRLAVDHCHHTGKVRGLLCLLCNSGIGKLKDDPELVHRAYEYLLRNDE